MKRKQEESFYLEEDKMAMTEFTIQVLLKAIKDRCLMCHERKIIEMMGCKTKECSLWGIRAAILEYGDKLWEQISGKLEKGSESSKNTVSNVKDETSVKSSHAKIENALTEKNTITS